MCSVSIFITQRNDGRELQSGEAHGRVYSQFGNGRKIYRGEGESDDRV